MPPKEKKKKKAKKAPPYLTDDAALAPYGVKVDQLVRNTIGMQGAVLGAKVNSEGQSQLWVKWATGLEAPVESNNIFLPKAEGNTDGVPTSYETAGFQACGQPADVHRKIAALQKEREELEAKWGAYNADQGKLQAEANKKKKKKKKPPPPPAEEMPAEPPVLLEHEPAPAQMAADGVA